MPTICSAARRCRPASAGMPLPSRPRSERSRVAPDYEDVWQLRLQLAVRAGDDAAAAALRAEVAARFPDASWWQRGTGSGRAPALALGGLRRRSPLERRARLEPAVSARRLADCRSRNALWRDLAQREIRRVRQLARCRRRLAGAAGVAARRRARPSRRTPGFCRSASCRVDATRAWTAGWGTAFGVRQRDYATGDVSSYSFTGEKYISDYRIAYRLDHSRQSGARFGLDVTRSSLTWYPSDRRSLGVTLGAGEEIEIDRVSIGCCTPMLPTSR